MILNPLTKVPKLLVEEQAHGNTQASTTLRLGHTRSELSILFQTVSNGQTL
jgi:hypothetical protein